MLSFPALADSRPAFIPDAPVPARLPLDLAVIVPTRNEADNIAALLARLDAALAGLVWEAVFVDDDSPDGTAERLRAVALADPRVRVLQRVGRRGLASAVIEGMLATAAPVLAVIDADLQHDETVLPRLFDAVAQGRCDLAVGSRYMEGGGVGDWNRQRHAASRWATGLANRLVRAPLTDPMSGFFVVTRPAMMAALPRLSGGGFKILLDLVASSPTPLRVVELPYCFRTRAAGESKLDVMVGAEYLKLLADKTVGRLVPIRLLAFLAVGGLGLAVHLAVLATLTLADLAPFKAAQALALLAAITSNFVMNNLFTYRDRRLRGRRFALGLISFYAVCLMGALANVGVAASVYGDRHSWWLAGLAGATIGAVWNFAASSVTTWRR